MNKRVWGFTAAGLISVIIVALSVWLAPWWHAGTTPVIIRMEVPDGVAPSISWGDPDQAKLPLVQIETGLWSTELPPRGKYKLALHLPEGVPVPSINELSVLQLDAPRRDLYRVHAPPLGPPVVNNGWATFGILDEIRRQDLSDASGPMIIAAALASLFIVMGSSVWAIFRIDPNYISKSRSGASGHLPVWLGLLLLVCGLLHVYIAVSSGAIFWPADSIGYGQRAMALLERGTLEVGNPFHELSRPPGTPILNAAAFGLIGYDLDSISLLQSTLYVIISVFLVLVLHRQFPTWIWYIVGPLVVLAPAPLMVNRVMASEAPFMLAVLLTVALLIQARTSRLPMLWFTLAGIAAGYGLITRLNAVVILTPALLFLLASLWSYLRKRNWRELQRQALPWVLFTAVALLPLLVYTIRNAYLLDYAKPTDLGALSRVEALYKGGTLDSRSLQESGIYTEVISKRFESSYNFEGWGTASIFTRDLVSTQGLSRGESMKLLDQRLDRIADANAKLLPIPFKVASFIRSFGWTLWMIRDPNFQPFGPSAHVFYSLTDEEVAYVDKIVKDWVNPHLEFYQAEYGVLHRLWNWTMQAYRPSFRFFVTVAILVYAFSALKGNALPVLVIMPYFANLVLICLLGVAILRYTEPIMPLFLLGLPMVFSTSRNPCQE